MKKTLLLIGMTAIVSSLFVGLAGAEDTTTLNGEYVWTGRGTSGDLEAIFTPTGEGTWDVLFNFAHRGQPHTYTGTAEGSLSEGKLSGTVFNENKNRTFKFRGKFEDGKFRGTHVEIKGDGEKDTGTMTLE